jgi:small conductance mechanosensitive channel
VLYGLNALYATALLVVGWYLAGLAQGFVSRTMTITHQIDALVTAFVATLHALRFLQSSALLCCSCSVSRRLAWWRCWAPPPLAIGLALQGTLSHFAAGVMLLLFRPFRIGDEVEVAGKFGKVRSLSLFMTELIASDNTQILLPNGSVWGAAIINHAIKQELLDRIGGAMIGLATGKQNFAQPVK